MNIIIQEHAAEPGVIILCRTKDAEVLRLRDHIELFGHRLAARSDGETIFVEATDILYFESVDDRTFLYTERAIMEIRLRLCELEESLESRGFLRISKSVVVNLQKIRSLRPEINRTILATMTNGEHLVISRSYVSRLRQVLDQEEGL